MPSLMDSSVYREGAGFQRRALESLESVPTSAFLLLGTGCDRRETGRASLVISTPLSAATHHLEKLL